MDRIEFGHRCARMDTESSMEFEQKKAEEQGSREESISKLIEERLVLAASEDSI